MSEYGSIGLHYDLIFKLDGIEIPPQNINSCSIKESIFERTSKLDVILADSGHILENAPIEDGSLIEISIARRHGEVNLNLFFYITSFQIEATSLDNGLSTVMVRILASQKTESLFIPIRTRCLEGTTSEIIKQLVEGNFKYEKRIDSRDYQKWYQINMSDYDMIYHVLASSYVGDYDAALAFVNRHNKFIYTSLLTQAKRDVKTICRFDKRLALFDGSDIDVNKQIEISENAEGKKIFYFDHWDFKNIQPILNYITSYGINGTYYDFKKRNVVTKDKKVAPLTKYMNRDSSDAGDLVDSVTYNLKTGNTHQNYYNAKINNRYVLDAFFGSMLEIVGASINSLNIGDKVEVQLPSISNKNNISDTLDVVNSGEYIIGAINHNIQKGGIYTNNVVLFRNGYNNIPTNIKPRFSE